MTEPDVVINGIRLNTAQSMALRVAVSGQVMLLDDPKYRAGLGIIADAYQARFQEIEKIMFEGLK